ncbi:MAG: helix-turn-helix domain-containing protein [Bacteroidia bacterium]|nr:helix-turn-helix domain-containing protein [Bacteroidia bacterium]
MNVISKNLKFLRAQKGWTQKQLAEKLGVKQSVIGAYEEARATPPLPCLLDIAETFQVSLDILSRKELSKVPEPEWKAKPMARGKEILAITVDKDDRENVELVSQKASAGYLNGYQDPEFIRDLPRMNVPVLPRAATYRAFEIKGDSMLPVQPGSIVFGEYIDNLDKVKNGNLYVVVTKTEGIVFKRMFNFSDDEKFLLVSDNRQYQPYAIAAEDILEVWQAKGFFSTKFPGPDEADRKQMDHLALTIYSLQEELARLKKK